MMMMHGFWGSGATATYSLRDATIAHFSNIYTRGDEWRGDIRFSKDCCSNKIWLRGVHDTEDDVTLHENNKLAPFSAAVTCYRKDCYCKYLAPLLDGPEVGCHTSTAGPLTKARSPYSLTSGTVPEREYEDIKVIVEVTGAHLAQLRHYPFEIGAVTSSAIW